MAGKIEIVENTLLKLLIRRGINADRLNIILNEGELGYTTDTQKLFIGDGSTLGGILITGTKFLGVTGDLTTLAPGDINDLGYNTITRQLNYISSNTGSLISDWTPVSNLVVSAADGTIAIDTGSGVKLGDCAGAGLVKDSSNKIEIDESIATNIITPKTAPYLSLPQSTSFGDINYTFPSNGSVNSYLRLNSNGALTWSQIGGTSNTFVNGEIISVGTILTYADTSLPSNNRWLLCDGSYKSTIAYPQLSAVVGTDFGPLSTNGGVQHFKLPDLRGKVVVGFTNSLAYDISGNGKTFAFATSGGEYQHILSELEMPAHTHTLRGRPDQSSQSFDGAVQAGVGFTWTVTTDSTGGNGPHNNIQPYLALNYIIKALPDPVAECQISIGNSLTASEAIQGDVFNINPLSGNYTIGLDNIITAQNVGYLTVNSKGRVTQFDITSAGNVINQGVNNTEIVHDFGFINFLHTPVPIANFTLFGTIPETWQQRINVYPTLSSSLFGSLATPAVNIPNRAKNVIIQTQTTAFTQGQIMYGALNKELLGSTTTRSTHEYVVHTGVSSSSQVILPLSANTNDGTISLAVRSAVTSQLISFNMEIVGWTL